MTLLLALAAQSGKRKALRKLNLLVEKGFSELMVPLAGLEPARCFHHLILSQARLPIPPQGQPAEPPRPKRGRGATLAGGS
jgi:hypothetical protein